MREFKRKLSVIMVIAMILALIPGAGAREITARAAEKVEGLEHLNERNVGWDHVFYRGTMLGVTYRAEFATSSNAKSFIDTVNANPDDVIEFKILDKSGKPAEGIKIQEERFGAWPAEEWDEEEGSNAVIFQYVVDVKDDAPDSVVVQVQVGDKGCRSDVEIKDMPTSEKKLTVSGRKSVEVGKTIRIAVTADSEEAANFIEYWSDDERKAQETGDWENQKDWKTVYWPDDQTGTTKYFEILGLNEGTSTYEFYVTGSEEETKTTVEITVKPRTMTLSESEIELSVADQDTVSIRDIEFRDITDIKDSEWNYDEDGWLQLYNKGYHPDFKISDPTVARLVPDERNDENDTGWFTRRRIEPLKEGTATITVEWLGAKAEAVLTVTGAPLQDEINKIFSDYYGNHEEGVIPASDLRGEIIPKISELVEGRTLTDRAWNVLDRLNGECGQYVNAYSAMLLHESINTLGLYEKVEYFAASMTIPDQIHEDGEPWKQFWVALDDAAEADVNSVSGTGKTGFVISFMEGLEWADEEELTPITELKIPVRVTLAIPEDLADVAEKDLVVYYVGGTAARSASGTATELSSGYVVKKGDSLLLQIDQPGTYVLAKRISNTPSSSGGYSYSSGSSSKVTTSYIPGWVQNETGWWYRYSDGTWPANAWAQLAYNGRTDWYHFDANGYMQTGWFTDTDGRVYYLNPVSDGWMGSMFVGSHVIDGKTYYFNEADDGHQGALVQ